MLAGNLVVGLTKHSLVLLPLPSYASQCHNMLKTTRYVLALQILVFAADRIITTIQRYSHSFDQVSGRIIRLC